MSGGMGDLGSSAGRGKVIILDNKTGGLMTAGGRLRGKVAIITGAARGQGRSHAVRLAEEGADIVAIDICAQIDSVAYPMATPEDLDETVKLVEDLDRRVMAYQADVRDGAELQRISAAAVAEFGHIDLVVGNQGIFSKAALTWELSDAQWHDTLDVNLTGYFVLVRAVVPAMSEAKRGGSIIFTSSLFGTKGAWHMSHYAAAKHGVLGLMQCLAHELAPHMIRVNTINPTMVFTPMIDNESAYRLFRPDLDAPTLQHFAIPSQEGNLLPIPWVEAVDISNAVVWLASNEARYVTGVALPVDAGAGAK
jgi:(+)-trans-carveol dehydrogenase